METSQHADLLARIAELKEEKAKQEDILKQNSKELVNALNPINMVKESLHDLAGDKNVRVDAATVGLKFGANLLIGEILGQPKSAKSALRTIIVQTIATTLINNNATQIIDHVTDILGRIEKKGGR